MVQKGKDKIFDLIVILLGILMLFSVGWVILFILNASFSSPKEVVMGRVLFFPKGVNFDAYKTILKQNDVWMGYGNTILYTAAGTAIKVFLTLITAYPLSLKDTRGKGFIMIFLMLTMYLSGGLIPSFLLIKSLGMYDTMWALILPSAVTVYNVIICRTFYTTTIPYELQESAQIDGASEIYTFYKIVLPLSAPIIAVLVLFFAVGHWNEFFNAMIYLKSREKFTLQIILREILILRQTINLEFSTADEMLFAAQQADEAEMMENALIIVASLPFMIAYPMLQKYFLKGIMVGALKG